MDTMLSRRQTIFGLGLVGLAAAWPRRALACVETPAQTIGPYYLDLNLLRSNVAEGHAGVPLRLALTIVDDVTCTPVPNAVVEIWHADASGTYSGFAAEGTTGETFCRGTQVSDADGAVEFVSVYPGWYPGRTPHIHLRVRASSASPLVSQLYAPESVNNAVYARAPYASRGQRDTTNATDSIYRGVSDPADVLLAFAVESGVYVGTATIGIGGTGTTTTTTIPTTASCGTDTTMTTTLCALTALSGAVTDATSEGGLRRRLLRLVDGRATVHMTQAETLAAAGKTRRAAARLVRAGVDLRGFRRLLASRAAQDQIDDTERATLDAAARQTITTIAALRQSIG